MVYFLISSLDGRGREHRSWWVPLSALTAPPGLRGTACSQAGWALGDSGDPLGAAERPAWSTAGNEMHLMQKYLAKGPQRQAI